MAHRCALCRRELPRGGREQLRGTRANTVQIRLEPRRRLGGTKIRIVDSGREQFVDGEYYTPAMRFAAVIGGGVCQILRGRERRE